MRVLIVSHLLGREVGAGVARRTVTVARALARQGARVQLLGTDAGITAAERAELSDLDVTLARCGSSRFPLPLLPPSRLSRLVARADVALLFNHWSALNATVYTAARHHGVPHIVCPCGALPIGGGRSQTIKRAYNALAGLALVRDARGWVATTRLERREFEPYGIDAERVAVIPNAVTLESVAGEAVADAEGDAAGDLNGVANGDATVAAKGGANGDALVSAADQARAGALVHGAAAARATEAAAEALALRAALGTGDAPFVLFMGRLNHIKGPDLLLEAFARVASSFPAQQLVFAGHDAGLRTQLSSRAAALGLAPRVRFAGFLQGAAKRAAYAAATLLVVPSRREAMSLVALEAGAVGTPVLLTDTCGFDDVEESGAGGERGSERGDAACIVPPTVDGLADGLRRLLADAPELPRRGARLRRRIVAAYTWERVGARWMDLVTRVAAEARA